MKRYYYSNFIHNFFEESEESILGKLTQNHHFSLDIQQKYSWLFQIKNIKDQLNIFPYGKIFLEFSIPRMGKRVDAIFLYAGIIFVIEYKVGADTYDRHAIDQALDYALDLKNFHEYSHDRPIVPVVIATAAPKRDMRLNWYSDQVAIPLLSNGEDLKSVIRHAAENLNQASIRTYGFAEDKDDSLDEWSEGNYKPTPTIVEAAQALYQGHNVEEISRSDSGAINLGQTTRKLNEIIHKSRLNNQKAICFVTGVPGAGKTLAGLNISTQKEEGHEEHAVFLSGNGPLVTVLREALARDEVDRSKTSIEPIDKKTALKKVSTFIQNIHHFRDEGLRSQAPPVEHVVVFDEAQRAWNKPHAERFMKQKRGEASFNMSEPEFLINLMDRRDDWATIICLIGGGQEINTGEAGLIEWFEALQKHFPHWCIYHSGQLTHPDYSWGHNLSAKLLGLNSTAVEALHLAISVRSYRAEKLSEFVGAIIEGDATKARSLGQELPQYPMAVTRNLNKARQWLRNHARGTERLGLVASSGAIRLKPDGLHVKAKIDPANWFLNGKEDIRSSYYLEDVATEFDIQGLELDWAGVCWDADFRRVNDAWNYYDFRGTKWQNIKDDFRRTYLANAYRVLLTRARQGMVIYIPEGDFEDYTRLPEYYEETFTFLRSCGIKIL
ncbi:DUF2075 domain-containing protein [Fodinicurvata halophila]|uniref:DUF2075 domain-containing protein n=1 Tax=Fodinicurvata halophila TaxID=1419723 RepID=A0ABV8UFP7_9PROT